MKDFNSCAVRAVSTISSFFLLYISASAGISGKMKAEKSFAALLLRESYKCATLLGALPLAAFFMKSVFTPTDKNIKQKNQDNMKALYSDLHFMNAEACIAILLNAALAAGLAHFNNSYSLRYDVINLFTLYFAQEYCGFNAQYFGANSAGCDYTKLYSPYVLAESAINSLIKTTSFYFCKFALDICLKDYPEFIRDILSYLAPLAIAPKLIELKNDATNNLISCFRS